LSDSQLENLIIDLSYLLNFVEIGRAIKHG